MSEIVALGAVGADPAARILDSIYSVHLLDPAAQSGGAAGTSAASGNFADLIAHGLARMNAKVAHADQMVTQFALDGSTPIHHVTIALEEARLAVEMAMQVRQRLLEGYRELMNLQL
ncbi:flagellar hook-basal body complex protein FliE [Altererythrobacter sp. Z27]|uniref:flagellar hook-basal body complex protein FliE n=1 Tax=Altererythrobacter sp. Z27 TaxID=3461147 RepID=UPI004044F24B